MIDIASVKYFSEKCWLRCVTTWSSWYPYKELWRLPLYFINVKVLTWKVMLILAFLLICGWGWVYRFTYMSLVVSQYKILVCPTATFVLKNIGMFLWLLCVMATLVNPPTVMLSILQIFFFKSHYVIMFVRGVVTLMVQSMIRSTPFSIPVPEQPAQFMFHTCNELDEFLWNKSVICSMLG